MTIFPARKSGLLLAAVAMIFASCSSKIQTSVRSGTKCDTGTTRDASGACVSDTTTTETESNPSGATTTTSTDSALKLTSSSCTDPDLSQVTTTQTFMLCNGTTASGTLDISTLSVGVIKSGVTVAGITGQYPSATYPLTGANATADLTLATFDAKIKDGATNFEWFDSAGTRYQNTGDSDIDSNNIADSISIFGTSGNVVGLTASDAWNLRAGVTVGSVTGKLKTSCRNGGNLAIHDITFPGKSAVVTNANERLTMASHGFTSNQQVRLLYTTAPGGLNNSTTYYVRYVDANTIELSASAGPGAAIDITSDGAGVTVHAYNDGTMSVWDTIDDYNNAGAILASSPWSSDNFCGGVEATANDSNVWKDVTSTICDSGGDECRYKDKISNLEWAETVSTSSAWGAAIETCRALTHDGVTGWRLPTQRELMDAYTHGIRSAANANWITSAQIDGSFFWSSSTVSTSRQNAWAVYLAYGNAYSHPKINPGQVVCVR